MYVISTCVPGSLSYSCALSSVTALSLQKPNQNLVNQEKLFARDTCEIHVYFRSYTNLSVIQWTKKVLI